MSVTLHISFPPACTCSQVQNALINIAEKSVSLLILVNHFVVERLIRATLFSFYCFQVHWCCHVWFSSPTGSQTKSPCWPAQALVSPHAEWRHRLHSSAPLWVFLRGSPTTCPATVHHLCDWPSVSLVHGWDATITWILPNGVHGYASLDSSIGNLLISLAISQLVVRFCS